MGVKLFATDEAILSPDWVSNLALINAYDMRSEWVFLHQQSVCDPSQGVPTGAQRGKGVLRSEPGPAEQDDPVLPGRRAPLPRQMRHQAEDRFWQVVPLLRQRRSGCRKKQSYGRVSLRLEIRGKGYGRYGFDLGRWRTSQWPRSKSSQSVDAPIQNRSLSDGRRSPEVPTMLQTNWAGDRRQCCDRSSPQGGDGPNKRSALLDGQGHLPPSEESTDVSKGFNRHKRGFKNLVDRLQRDSFFQFNTANQDSAPEALNL